MPWGNGYRCRLPETILPDANPYVYPEILPRVNASRWTGGRPGCWQADHPGFVAWRRIW